MRDYFLKLLFDSKTRRGTWRKLSSLLKNDMPLRLALTMIRDRYLERKSPLGRLFSMVLLEVGKGFPLDVAFLPWVPLEEAMLIRSGVKSGELPKALADCAELIDAQSKTLSSLIGSVAYPVLLMTMFVMLLLVLSFRVMPALSRASNPETWTGAAAIMYKLSSILASPFGLVILLVGVVVIVAVFISMPNWTGKTRLYVENIPPWSIYRLLKGSVWLFTLATLLKADIALNTIFKDMVDNIAMSPWLSERVKAMQKLYRSDGNFGSILLHLNMKFPDEELAEELAVYATLPDFENHFYERAKEWLDEGTEAINKQAKILNTVALLAMGALVGLFGVAYGSIQQQFGQGLGVM
jgi:type II secretory pathway component PulF